MRGWLGRRQHVYQILLIFFLFFISFVVNKFEFPRINAFVRDSLQYLNSTEYVDPTIVTLNIDIHSHNIKYPHAVDDLARVIAELQKAQPRYIIMALEPLDITRDPLEKTTLYDFLLKQKNLYLNGAEASNPLITFRTDSIFKKYPRFLDYTITADKISGAQDGKNRRAILEFDSTGPAQFIADLRAMGLSPKHPSYYKYSFHYWETTQAYIKSFKEKIFGNYSTKELLDHTIDLKYFANKIVIVGAHDEFSFLSLPSAFDFFGKPSENVKDNTEPYQHSLANLINFHLSGDYIKFFPNPYGVYIIFALLTLLILLRLDLKKKLLIFACILPFLLIAQIILYISGSYFIDFSKPIALLIFIQYLAVPFVMALIIKKQEHQKSREITEAKIDALLAVSEKVAHDIRSPLSAITLLIGKAKFDRSEQKEIVDAALNRIDNIAENILHKYKTKNPENFKPSALKIPAIIEAAILEKRLLDPDITYTTNFNGEVSFIALGDKLELERVLGNVIDNSVFALRAAPRKEISFKVSSSGQYIITTIQDNGPGISSDVLAVLGNARITTKGPVVGNGIGLLHSKRSIEKMGGIFEIASTSAGTKISISLKTFDTTIQ